MCDDDDSLLIHTYGVLVAVPFLPSYPMHVQYGSFICPQCGKYTTLEAILDAEGVNSHLIRNCILTEQWEHICDCKGECSITRHYIHMS